MKYIYQGIEKKQHTYIPIHLALVQLYCFALRHLVGTSLRRCPVPPSENDLPFMVHQNWKPVVVTVGKVLSNLEV